MNLADELRGIKPVRLPGISHVVINDDPPEAVAPIAKSSMIACITEWIAASAGVFSAFDICQDTGFQQKHVSMYLRRLQRKGVVRQVGTSPGLTQKPLLLWRRT